MVLNVEMNGKLPLVLMTTTLINLFVLAQSNETIFNSTNEEITIPIGEDSVAAYGLLAAGERRKETVILLHGFPGNERNLDLAQSLRRQGRNVIFFNYRGSWGSQGNFLYSNCLEDVEKVMDFFDKPLNSKKYRVKANSYILIGHSLGGGIALLKGAKDDRVIKVGVYSPAHIGTASIEYLKLIYEYSKGLFMLNIDPSKFYKELVDNRKSYNVLQYAEELSKKDLLIIDENRRNDAWISQLKNVEYIVVKTDHSFSNKRLELINYFKEWIE